MQYYSTFTSLKPRDHEKSNFWSKMTRSLVQLLKMSSLQKKYKLIKDWWQIITDNFMTAFWAV